MYFYNDSLESSRLITRKLSLNDINAWSKFFEDKEAVEFFPGLGSFGSTKEWSEFWIRKQLKRYEDQQYGLQALFKKDSGEFVGQCGLLAQEIDGQKEIEVGYHIFKKYWGQGYAPEAAKLFIDYAFENKITDSIVSIIHVNNTRSQRVAEKNGLKREKRSNWSGLEVFVYRINKNR